MGGRGLGWESYSSAACTDSAELKVLPETDWVVWVAEP